MTDDHHQEWLDKATIVYNQEKETVAQDSAGVTVRLGTITCPCGRKRGITMMYRCLYCKIWFCQWCAEDHFGKTVEQYKAEKLVGGSAESDADIINSAGA